MTTKGIVFLLLASVILASCAEGLRSSSWRAKAHQLLWKGWASTSIDYTTEVQAVIRKAAHDIFVYLPVKH